MKLEIGQVIGAYRSSEGVCLHVIKLINETKGECELSIELYKPDDENYTNALTYFQTNASS